MKKNKIKTYELDAFVLACKENGIIISKNPQKISTAKIIVGEKALSISKEFRVVRKSTINKGVKKVFKPTT